MSSMSKDLNLDMSYQSYKKEKHCAELGVMIMECNAFVQSGVLAPQKMLIKTHPENYLS